MPLGRLLVLIFSLSLAYQATTHPLPQSNANKPALSLLGTPEATHSLSPVNSPKAPDAAPEKTMSGLTVTRVVDGDTIEMSNGNKVRYIGVDTPEVVDPRKPVQCFGVEASSANKALVLNQVVRLEKDISETDKYGRLLRYVWVGNTLINQELVRLGFARSSSYPPDIKYQSLFQTAETEARAAERGLWSACSTSSAPITQPSGVASKTPPDPSCPIKGNISSSGKKIYHVPGGTFYKATVINPATGERWFCSTTEAEAAGWIRSQK